MAHEPFGFVWSGRHLHSQICGRHPRRVSVLDWHVFVYQEELTFSENVVCHSGEFLLLDEHVFVYRRRTYILRKCGPSPLASFSCWINVFLSVEEERGRFNEICAESTCFFLSIRGFRIGSDRVRLSCLEWLMCVRRIGGLVSHYTTYMYTHPTKNIKSIWIIIIIIFSFIDFFFFFLQSIEVEQQPLLLQSFCSLSLSLSLSVSVSLIKLFLHTGTISEK